MKKVIRFTAMAMVLVLIFVLASCSKKKTKYKVGIIQQLEHPALDLATEGFKDALKDLLGDKIRQ